MKKAYIMPLAEVVKTATEELICLSLTSSEESVIGDGGIFDGTGSADSKDDFENVFENLW